MTSPHPTPHRDPRLVGLVALGGAVGSVLRHAVGLALPAPSGWPLGTLAVNVSGAFLLGLLLEAVARRGPETRRLQRLRLLLGTGLLGGFTTYSAFALETDRLLDGGDFGVALGYVAVTLVAGTLAAALGVAVGLRTPEGAAGRLLHRAGQTSVAGPVAPSLDADHPDPLRGRDDARAEGRP